MHNRSLSIPAALYTQRGASRRRSTRQSNRGPLPVSSASLSAGPLERLDRPLRILPSLDPEAEREHLSLCGSSAASCRAGRASVQRREEVYAASTSLQVLSFEAFGTTKSCVVRLPITIAIFPLDSISTRPSTPAAITA